MIPFIVLCLLAFVGWLLVWSIVSFVKIRDLEQRIGRLKTGFEDQAATPGGMHAGLRGPPAASPSPPAAPPVAPAVPEPVPPVVPPVEADALPDGLTLPPYVIPEAPPPLPVRAPPPPAAPRLVNWEQFMGAKLFAWTGGLALFLGVVFFVKYSFDNNWVTPVMRVSLGFLTGAGLLAGGVALSQRAYRVTAHTLCATGVVILSAVTFACDAIYRFPQLRGLPDFLLMMLITATACVVAVALEAQVVALLGMLGGFLTPVLIRTGHDNPLGLFGYIALLDAGLLAVVLHRRWNYLGALAALGTVAWEIIWAAVFFEAGKIHTAINVFLGFDGLFLLAFALARRRGNTSRWPAGAAAGAAFVSLGFAFCLLDYPVIARQPWLLFTFLLGADLSLLVLAVLDARLARLHLAAGSAAFLLLGAWIAGPAGAALLSWALGACFVFAVLHAVFPLVLQRLRPDAAPAWWAHLFPPVALALVLLAIARIPDVSFLVWPVALVIDLLAIGLALATGALLAVAATLVLTLLATGLWIAQAPAETTGIPSLLLLVGGFGVLFFAAAVHGLRRLAARPVAGRAPGWLQDPAAAGLLPAFSAALPFLLLMMIVVRMPLAGPSPVFGLALLLAVLLLGLARTLGDGALPLVALVCTASLECVWLQRGAAAASPAATLVWNLGFFAVFAVFPFLSRARFSGRALPWIASALAAPAHFCLVYELIRRAWPNDYMGAIPAAFALPALAVLVGALRALPAGEPRRLDVLAWFGGVALLFITLIFPIQFERQWITLGWALEGAALLWLFHRVPHDGLRLTGAGLLVAAFVRLALNPAVLGYHPRAATPVFNWYLYAFGLTAGCLLAGARLLAPPRHRVLGANAPALLNALGGVLAFLLLNIEIADYFNPAGQVLTFKFSGDYARDMTYSIGWAFFAFGLLVLGIVRRVRATRYAAIALLSATLLKLLFHDLASLDPLHRIFAFIVVAGVAILASFLYQRFLPPETKK